MMTDAEFLRKLVASGVRGDSDSDGNALMVYMPALLDEVARLESIATKYEQMAQAVMEAWDQWHSLNALLEPMPYHLGAMNIAVGVVERATNKHPSEWTRESLAEWLGMDDVEQARLKFLADGGML